MNIMQLTSEFERALLLDAMRYFACDHTELKPLIEKFSQGVFDYTDGELTLMGAAVYNYMQSQHVDKKAQAALLRLSVMLEEYALTLLTD